ncbi:MAG: hypothetical protein JW860_06275, partial [Sedimentisphaerales bacterium]|nr:hypothetical protein [Sedimentisphaerales bacterium]
DVAISVDSAGLSEGVYNYDVTVSDPEASNSPQIVSVQLVILPPTIELSQTSYSFVYWLGGPIPDDQILSIRNSAGGALNWQITEACSWLDLTPTTGTSTGEWDDVAISVDSAGLSDGIYNYDVTVSDPNASNSPQMVSVQLEIFAPTIELSQSSYIFESFSGQANPDDQILSIRNSGDAVLYWQVTEECSWLEPVPISGSSTGEWDDVTFNVDITGLTAGMHQCQLEVSDPYAINNPQYVDITLYVGGIIYIPLYYPTIQEGIDAAIEGSTVIVSPGVYYENIRFKGIDITLTSTDPNDPNVIADTIIDANAAGRPVTFSGSETADCILRGFTLTGGNATGSYPDNNGGGIYGNSCMATIEKCTITGNTADYGGGLSACLGIISSCSIINNNSVYSGGLSACHGLISSCIIADNTADSSSGGLGSCNGIINHCTIVGNTANNNGGGLYNCSGNITNCILWGNSPDELYNSAVPLYSCVQGGSSGSGCIDIDPLLSDVIGKDYHLQWNSPCINSGDPSYVPGLDETDMDGQERITYGRVDMGADEVFPIAGDFDMDIDVDTIDLSFFAYYWLESNCDETDWCYLTDITHDSHVNLHDLAALSTFWLIDAP